MCARANVLRVADSSISQNNQWVGYRVCMCIRAASRDTLTPGGSKTDIRRAEESKGEAVQDTIKDGKSSLFTTNTYMGDWDAPVFEQEWRHWCENADEQYACIASFICRCEHHSIPVQEQVFRDSSISSTVTVVKSNNKGFIWWLRFFKNSYGVSIFLSLKSITLVDKWKHLKHCKENPRYDAFFVCMALIAVVGGE